MNHATELLYDRDNVLVYSGQDVPRALLVEAARQHLLELNIHHLEADDALVDRQGLVVAAWWAGETLGFCGKEHPQARAVTVVNLPRGLTERQP